MEIYALKGHKVKVTNKTKNNGYKYDSEKVQEHLEVDKEYVVDNTMVHQSSTDVYLQEFPGIPFNSVNFEDAIEQPDELTKMHPDYQRYHR